MSTDALSERVKIITQVDVARLLERVVLEIDERITFGDLTLAERRLQAWEEALGSSLSAIAADVARVKGRRGYGVASSAFTRRQLWRKDAVQWLRFAITAGSRRDYDRWKWAAATYLSEVQSFAKAQQQIQQNSVISKVVNARFPLTELRRYPVLNACLSERKTEVDRASNAAPALGAHALARVTELAGELQRYGDTREALLAKRRDAESQAREVQGTLSPATTARARSIDEQIAIYERIVIDAQRGNTLRRVSLDSEAVRTALDTYAPNESAVDATPLLARLATKFKRPAAK